MITTIRRSNLRKIMPSDFETQFNTRRTVFFHGRKIRFVDVTPPTLKSPIPIFIAPGWGETPRTFKGLMRLLYEAGFRVLSVTHTRQDLRLITRQNISRLEFQKSQAILSVLESCDIEKINAIAHSEGAVNIILAARDNISAFNKIVLVGPGGLVEHEPFWELSTRFIGNIMEGGMRIISDRTARLRLARSAVETVKYFFMNPILGLLEGSAISKSHLEEFLKVLHDQGISISVIHGSNDIVFPVKRMQSLHNLPWVEFLVVEGDHHDIYALPEKYMPFLKNQLLFS